MTRPVEFAQILLTCLKERLDVGPNPIAAEHVCLRFGEIVNPVLGTNTDECCTGLAWVRVARIEALSDLDDQETGNCLPTARRLTLELGTARCVSWGTTQYPTSCDAWTDAALKMDADEQAMSEAVCCFADTMADSFGAPRIAIGDYEPFGPDAICIRGTQTVTIDYDCGCPNGA